jgi:hypothetical protein
MLRVIMLNVVLLSEVVPKRKLIKHKKRRRKMEKIEKR